MFAELVNGSPLYRREIKELREVRSGSSVSRSAALSITSVANLGEAQDGFAPTKIKPMLHDNTRQGPYKCKAEKGPGGSIWMMLLLAPHVLGVWIPPISKTNLLPRLPAFAYAVPTSWNFFLSSPCPR